MFISLERAGNETITSMNWKYKIIDDSFEEVVEAADTLNAVIKVYKNKNLNVAKNIIKFIQFCKIKYYYNESIYCDSIFLIEWLYQCAPEYVDEVKKYMMLM